MNFGNFVSSSFDNQKIRKIGAEWRTKLTVEREKGGKMSGK